MLRDKYGIQIQFRTFSMSRKRGYFFAWWGARWEGEGTGKLFQHKLFSRVNAGPESFYNRLYGISWRCFTVQVIFSVKDLQKCVFGRFLPPLLPFTPKMKIVGRYTIQGRPTRSHYKGTFPRSRRG